jgi:hypothetical protein
VVIERVLAMRNEGELFRECEIGIDEIDEIDEI